MKAKSRSEIRSELDVMESSLDDMMSANSQLNSVGIKSKSLENLIGKISKKVDEKWEVIYQIDVEESDKQLEQDIEDAKPEVLRLVDQSKDRGFTFFVVDRFSNLEKAAKLLGMCLSRHPSGGTVISW